MVYKTWHIPTVYANRDDWRDNGPLWSAQLLKAVAKIIASAVIGTVIMLLGIFLLTACGNGTTQSATTYPVIDSYGVCSMHGVCAAPGYVGL